MFKKSSRFLYKTHRCTMRLKSVFNSANKAFQMINLSCFARYKSATSISMWNTFCGKLDFDFILFCWLIDESNVEAPGYWAQSGVQTLHIRDGLQQVERWQKEGRERRLPGVCILLDPQNTKWTFGLDRNQRKNWQIHKLCSDSKVSG